jgi:hypothetical protein
MNVFSSILLGLIFLLPSDSSALWAAEEISADTNALWLAEHYTKYEQRIPMRDGIRLFTRVYVPKDDSQAWPIMLTRTPYALKPYGADNYNDPSGTFAMLARDKFVLVMQDVRGRYASEGEYVQVRPFNPNKGPKDTDESSDAWDTIDWLVKHVPNNNGKVGMFGISYPGFYTSMAMIDSHPALKAASPQAPVSDWFMGDDLHHNGALFLSQSLGFIYGMEQKSDDPLHDGGRHFIFNNPDGYDFFLRMGPLGNSDTVLFKGAIPVWTEFLAHPNYDNFWQARNIRPHLKNIHCAVLNVGGWFDGEDLFGTLETYRWTQRQNPGLTNLLVMGPWPHGDWGRQAGDKLGNISFHAKTAEFYRAHIELPFFRRYLKNDTNNPLPGAYVFQTGLNEWRRFDTWPPRQVREQTLFFQSSGNLSFTPPKDGGSAFDEYVSDPAKPVPFTLEVTTSYPRSYPVQDQRFASSRPDVLVFNTEPLEEDMTFAGPIKAVLHVSTTGTDADWIVKLIDVFDPDFPNPEPNPANVVMGGYQQLVRGDVMRARFRNGFEEPEATVPGELTKIEFTLADVCHTFRRGHRVMIQVQSSWFPLVDRNPQTFVNIATAKPEDFRKATQRVYHTSNAASAIIVQVLPSNP